MNDLANFGRWMLGAGLVATGAIALGYGAGIMWRAWVALTGMPSIEQKANLMFGAFMSIGIYAMLIGLVCRALARS